MKNWCENWNLPVRSCLQAAIVFAACGFAATSHAATPASLAQAPLFLVTSAEPLVMLNLSNDHQLFFKAYDDWSDIDGDPNDQPAEETTYEHQIEYYGYFNSHICYNHNGTEFVPAGDASANGNFCDGIAGDWSGNFLNWATMTRMDSVRKLLYGGFRSTDTASTTILERTFLPTDAHSFVKYYNDPATISRLTPYNAEISICNTTYAAAGNSRDVTAPPLMRIAQGNFSMWTGHEGRQCNWSEESNTSNNNQPAITEIDAATTPPSRNAAGSRELVVRVQVCVPGFEALDQPPAEPKERHNCQRYPDGNSKPFGLLQQYSEDGSIHFGLLTGSYARNKSGGVVRKNVGSFADELNVDTNGTFVVGANGIVDTINRLRLTRYDYAAGQYNVLDSCTFAQFGFNDGQCSNWGNPQSEIYLESLRYFGGLSETGAFATNDANYIVNGLPRPTWDDPLSNDNYCAPVNIIQFNASTNSFDGDQLAGFGDLPAASGLDSYTNDVGVGEGVTDAGQFFIGQIPGSTDRSCTPKDLDQLSDASGICPEAPWLEGTYDMAGMAYFARTESIRDDLDGDDGDEADIRVNTYGVALSPAQPVIEIPVPGDANGREVILLPACMEYRDGGARHNGNCAIVDFRIVNPHTEAGGVGTGKFLVLWESAQAGGDYDQDMGGIISYTIDSTNITVTTQVYGASTGGIHGFGYVVSGTTQDGLHIHSGHNGFDEYTDPYGLLDCDDAPGGSCNSGDPATSQQYALGTTVAQQLQTPLYYAAKWGGFKEAEEADDRPAGAAGPNDVPDQSYEWDANNDGLPDQYFFSTNPRQLADSLAEVFLGISKQQASAAATAANSQRADVGTFVFQARFSSANWIGELLKLEVDLSDGDLQLHTNPPNTTTGWGLTGDAGALLTGTTVRHIITFDPLTDGIPFQWDDLPSNLQDLLQIDPDTGAPDAKGALRLAYLRGSANQEMQSNNGGTFRNRVRLLGDIVNSAPVFVGDPGFAYPDFLEPEAFETYSEFVERVGGRPQTLWVGANDGMLHGFDVDSGVEVLAYVPRGVFANLPQLTSPNYTHRYFVDGSPSVGDATFDSDDQWHTVLLGGLNGGGRSIYALDVTNEGGTAFSEAGAADLVLWEIDNTTTNFGELGFTYSRPAIVKNSDGEWVAMFGNGYASASGHAVFYVVDIEDGSLISAVTVDTTGNNGLSTVAPVDTNGDEIIDIVYAGDLKGNLWKFIPSTSVSGEWQAAFSGAPLFTTPADSTGYAQPITTRPEVGTHPDGLPGVMVYFGTGQYFENGDNLAGTDVQRFYGIWDLWDRGNTSSLTNYGQVNRSPPARSGVTLNASSLLQQCVTTGTFEDSCVSNAVSATGETLADFTVRFVSDETIARWDWEPSFATGDGKMGWYIDLPELGEKQVTNAILRSGRIIFVTLVPSDHSCSDGGESWLMELDAADGSRLNVPIFDLNGDGVFDAQDTKTSDPGGDANPVVLVPAGKKSKEGVIQPPTILFGPDGKKEYKYSSGSSGNIELTTENPMPMTQGRKSWIQLQ